MTGISSLQQQAKAAGQAKCPTSISGRDCVYTFNGTPTTDPAGPNMMGAAGNTTGGIYGSSIPNSNPAGMSTGTGNTCTAQGGGIFNTTTSLLCAPRC